MSKYDDESPGAVDRILGPLTQRRFKKTKRNFKKAFRKTTGDMRREEPFPYKSFFFNPKLNERAKRKQVPGVLNPHRHGKILRPLSPQTEYPQSSADDDDDPLQNMQVRNRQYTKRVRQSPTHSSSSSPYVSNEDKSPQKPKQQNKKRRRASLSPLTRKLKRTMAAL